MDPSLAEKLSSLAGKTDAFARLEPEQVPAREISAPQMAAVLGLVTTRPDVDVTQLARALRPKATRIKWAAVLAAVDSTAQQSFSIMLSSPDSVAAAVALLATAGGPDAVQALLAHRWAVLPLQTQLLAGVAALPPPRLNLAALGVPRVVEDGPLVSHPLNFVPLIHLALDAVCREPPSDITAKAFLDTHVKLAPDLFLLGGVSMPRPWEAIQERILINLFVLLFAESPDLATPVLAALRAYPQFLYAASSDLYMRDPGQLDRLALYASQGPTLDEWLDHAPHSDYGFVLELVAAADRLGLVSARELLVARFVTGGGDAVVALLDFMELKMAAASVAAAQGPAAGQVASDQNPNPLTLRTVAAFETLTASMDIPPDRVEQLKAIQVQCLQVYPRLTNFGQGHDEAILANNDLPTFPGDVEQEMKQVFQQMYENRLEIREVIGMLERLKQSDVPRDQDLFACMVHSLFDEYRFFPEYPVNALATTAVLFGSLIHFRLIDNVPLSIALRFILESLKQQVESNMFRFGLQALFELRQRLPEFPKYCSVLLSIPGLASQQQFYAQIKEIVFPPSGMEVAAEDNAFTSVSANVGLPPTQLEPPPEAVRDKVLFLVNNLSPGNVKAKSRELAAALDKRYYAWFSEYIVSERAIKEPNYHPLYIAMLDTINSNTILLHCLHVVYLHIVRLLNDDDGLAQGKRTQLKNLGAFLGSLMLARNRPILHDNINFKLLLAEAARKDRLAAVLPFVGKTLDKVATSLIFAPPCPWTMGIMAVLSELYQFGGLKLNLKFEIEVLCNALELKISDIEPAMFVRSDDAVEEMERLSLGPGPSGPAALAGAAAAAAAASLPAGLALGSAGSATSANSASSAASAGAMQLVGTSELVTNPALRRLFEAAISRTIQEVLLPVIERSASIASFTTKELVAKDYAHEADETKLQRAAHTMASVLAMSMSLVTAKDPFVESLATNTRALLLQQGYPEQSPLFDQVLSAARDNIEVIVPLVEAAARDKAIADVDDALQASYAARAARASSGARDGGRFTDPNAPDFAGDLPEPLAVRPGGVSARQQALYDDFALATDAPGEPAAAPAADTAVEQIAAALDRLTAVLAASSATSLAELAPTGSAPASDDNALVLISQILTVASRAAAKDEVALRVSQMVVSAVFQPKTSVMQREGLCFLLGKLCEMSPVTAKEVVLWLIYSDDERKYNVAVMGTLLRDKLVNACEIDVSLAKEVVARNKVAVSFAAGLILDAVLGAAPYCLRTEFTGTLEAFEVLAREEPGEPTGKAAQSVLDALHKSRGDGWVAPTAKARKKAAAAAAAGASGGAAAAAGAAGLSDRVGYVFAEWTRLVQHPCCTPRSLHLFVYSLSQNNLLGHAEPLFTLVRTALDVSVESYGKSVGFGHASDAFVGVDALAKLLVTVFETSDKMPAPQRLQYAQGTLTVCGLVLAAAHDAQGAAFDGRPYFRLFSTLLYEMSVAAAAAGSDGAEFWSGLLLAVAQLLDVLQPLALPAFTSSWLTLISHRHFLPRMLELPARAGWPPMAALLSAALRFMAEYASGKDFADPIARTYKAVLRVMLLLLHDYPEFLVEYASEFVAAMPSSFVQLRNLALSAVPPGLELPDPMTLADGVPRSDCRQPPPADPTDPGPVLASLGIRKQVDQALRVAGYAPITPALAAAVAQGLTLPVRRHDNGVDFDSVGVSVAGMHALAAYIASTYDFSAGFDASSLHAQLCLRLLGQLSAEGRYFFAAALADQLRYPNSTTYFYSQLILAAFLPAATTWLKDAADVRHVLTRVLLERIICNRPHPWGLMATFVQLLKGPQYKFWDLPFIKIAPEIEQMFSSLYSHITAA